jgi:hypothetical protein
MQDDSSGAKIAKFFMTDNTVHSLIGRVLLREKVPVHGPANVKSL